MKIQVLGTGCPKCVQLEQQAARAIRALGLDCEIEKVTDMDEILSFGVMMTPSLVIDGEVKSSGKVLSADQIQKMLQEVSS